MNLTFFENPQIFGLILYYKENGILKNFYFDKKINQQ